MRNQPLSSLRLLMLATLSCLGMVFCAGCPPSKPIPSIASRDIPIRVKFSARSRSRDIPGYAVRAEVTLQAPAGVSYTATPLTISNSTPDTGGEYTGKFASVPVSSGSYTVTIRGLTADGKVVATGTRAVTVSKDNAVPEVVASDSANETIRKVVATVVGFSTVETGRVVQISASALGDGDVILLQPQQGNFVLSVSDPAKAMVSDAVGNANAGGSYVKGLSPGPVNITAELRGGANRISSAPVQLNFATRIPPTQDDYVVNYTSPTQNMSFGYGYDYPSLTPRTAQPVVEPTSETVTDGGAGETTLDVELVTGKQSGETSTNITSSFAAKAAVAEFKADGNLKRLFESTTNSLKLIMTFRREFPAERFKDATIWTDAATNLWFTSPAQFRNLYGTHLVVGRQKTINVTINLTITSSSEVNIASNFLDVSAKYKAVSASLTLDNVLKNLKQGGTVSINVTSSGAAIEGLVPPTDPEQVRGYIDSVVNKLATLPATGATTSKFILVPYNTLKVGGAKEVYFPTATERLYEKYVQIESQRVALEHILNLDPVSPFRFYDWILDEQRTSLRNSLDQVEASYEALRTLYERIRQNPNDPNIVTHDDVDKIKNITDIEWPRVTVRQVGFVANPNNDGTTYVRLKVTGGRFSSMVAHTPVVMGNPRTWSVDLTILPPQSFGNGHNHGIWEDGPKAVGGFDVNNRPAYGYGQFTIRVYALPNRPIGHEGEITWQLFGGNVAPLCTGRFSEADGAVLYDGYP